ncbi:MAG: XRE family transcriptional regulator [Neisseriaceae bacterium]|nr:XRE family transcriptional regulator [Neisseriaceae bacterium]MBQ9724718.1 XRE family transcriptional regulator [Neisseriaceae bacterium]MBR0129177.1 XRE family transcriptional regulator [Neisseriaceae bacterium]
MKSFDDIMAALPKERQDKIRKISEEMMIDLQLQHIREELEMTQKQLADALGIAQPSVVALEKRGKDIKLSSLKRYIEAMGGKLSLSVELPNNSKTVSFRI